MLWDIVVLYVYTVIICYYTDDVACLLFYAVDKDSDESDEIPQAKPPRREAVYDFSDSEDEEEMEKRLQKIEANIRRRRKVSTFLCPNFVRAVKIFIILLKLTDLGV